MNVPLVRIDNPIHPSISTDGHKGQCYSSSDSNSNNNDQVFDVIDVESSVRISCNKNQNFNGELYSKKTEKSLYSYIKTIRAFYWMIRISGLLEPTRKSQETLHLNFMYNIEYIWFYLSKLLFVLCFTPVIISGWLLIYSQPPTTFSSQFKTVYFFVGFCLIIQTFGILPAAYTLKKRLQSTTFAFDLKFYEAPKIINSIQAFYVGTILLCWLGTTMILGSSGWAMYDQSIVSSDPFIIYVQRLTYYYPCFFWLTYPGQVIHSAYLALSLAFVMVDANASSHIVSEMINNANDGTITYDYYHMARTCITDRVNSFKLTTSVVCIAAFVNTIAFVLFINLGSINGFDMTGIGNTFLFFIRPILFFFLIFMEASVVNEHGSDLTALLGSNCSSGKDVIDRDKAAINKLEAYAYSHTYPLSYPILYQRYSKWDIIYRVIAFVGSAIYSALTSLH